MTDANIQADAIERDIKRTQNDMSETVNELHEKLQPRQLLRQFAGNGRDVPGQLFEAVKRNPAAAGLIAAGTLWLLSGKQAKMPSFGKGGQRGSHVAITRYEGEGEDVYQRRLEDAQGRLSSPSEGGRFDKMTSALKDRGKTTADWSARKHDEAPLAMGIAAAAAGALAAFALPKTEIEREKLAPLRNTAVNKASALKDQALDEARAKLDQGQTNAAQPEAAS